MAITFRTVPLQRRARVETGPQSPQAPDQMHIEIQSLKRLVDQHTGSLRQPPHAQHRTQAVEPLLARHDHIKSKFRTKAGVSQFSIVEFYTSATNQHGKQAAPHNQTRLAMYAPESAQDISRRSGNNGDNKAGSSCCSDAYKLQDVYQITVEPFMPAKVTELNAQHTGLQAQRAPAPIKHEDATMAAHRGKGCKGSAQRRRQ